MLNMQTYTACHVSHGTIYHSYLVAANIFEAIQFAGQRLLISET